MPILIPLINTVKRKLLWETFLRFFLIFFLLLSFSSSLSALISEEKPPSTFLQYLTEEKNRMLLNTSEIEKQSLPQDELDYLSKKKFIDSMIILNRAKLESLNAFYDNQIKQQQDSNQKLKELQQLPLTSANHLVQEKVANLSASLANSKTTLELINDNLSAAEHFQELLDEQLKKLGQWNIRFQLDKKLERIEETKTQLNKELQNLFQTNTSETKDHADKNTIDWEVKTLLNNQYIAFIQNELSVLDLENRIVKTAILLLQNSNTKTLQQVMDEYADVISQYKTIQQFLQQMANTLKAQEINYPSLYKKSFDSLQKRLQEELKKINTTSAFLVNKLAEHQNQQKKIILTRQSLSEYKIKTWPNILHKLVAIPGLFYKAVKVLVLKVYDSYRWLDGLHAGLLAALLLMILALFFILNQILKALSFHKERSSLTGYLYDGIVVVVKKNLPLFCVFFMLIAVFYYTNIAFAHYELFFNLFVIWFVFRSLIIISRLILVERISDYSGEDVRFYYRIKWMLLFGGWSAALMTFSHLMPLSLLLQDMFNRLFMLFILTISLVAWRSRSLILDLLNPLLRLRKRYIKNAISVLIILVPLTLFTTALIGLFGFFDLAWTLSRCQAFILMILVGYILARGLLFDALEYVSEWMISLLDNGWLWIEVFLKPLDKIIRLLLIITSVALIFELFGWLTDSLMLLKLEKLAKYSPLNITGIHITVESFIEFLLLTAVLYWVAKWTREFCYRWLYMNTQDPGLRNSFAVFTQYAVILLGSYIALRVLGFDFGGMSMILGGLAVGMGFGLKDFANNIVGGIMLLIERPVREGDIISIGGFEGQVAHIGIRSMRVSSWDNTEVLIPNAETFNKPFINWTHQSGIVRTVVPIKVDRADAPELIQQLILEVLTSIPEIVPSPPPEVFLKKIDEALIEFEVRYYINLRKNTVFSVRSKTLFAITKHFEERGVRHPITPFTVQLKEDSGDFFSSKKSDDQD